ncbi:MAG TPA: hypothetical protein VHN80_11065 [Kineosporiaceae bacterium]|nr:hypothetical protein [Kineosporiaceae bacterium]
MASWDDGPGRLPDPDAPGVIPDDASALEPDRLAWLAEQGELPLTSSPSPRVTAPAPRPLPEPSPQQAHGRSLGHRMIFTWRWRQFGLSGPILTLFLLAAALVGVVAVTLITRPGTPAPAAAALAQVAVARVPPRTDSGHPATVEQDGGPVIGHRLPGVPLAGDVRSISSETLRPAVIVMVPAARDGSSPQVYDGVVGAIYRQASEFRIPVWLIAPGAPGVRDASRTYLTHLDETATSGGARWAVDPTGELSAALDAQGPTLIAVRANGAIIGMRRDLPLDPVALPALEPLFARLAIVNR